MRQSWRKKPAQSTVILCAVGGGCLFIILGIAFIYSFCLPWFRYSVYPLLSDLQQQQTFNNPIPSPEQFIAELFQAIPGIGQVKTRSRTKEIAAVLAASLAQANLNRTAPIHSQDIAAAIAYELSQMQYIELPVNFSHPTFAGMTPDASLPQGINLESGVYQADVFEIPDATLLGDAPLIPITGSQTAQLSVFASQFETFDILPIVYPFGLEVYFGRMQSSGLELPDQPASRSYMLELINTARLTQGLSAVTLDDLASSVAQIHAEEMATGRYLSHWNLQGNGPDIRYNLAGGADKVQENIYSYLRTSGGTPIVIEDWQGELSYAFNFLMSSPHHRDNILAPEHTRVGIGLAYDPSTGEFRVTQEFVNHYIELFDAPHTARPGETLSIKGRISDGATEPLINLAYEAIPDPKTIWELGEVVPYRSAAATIDAFPVLVEPDGSFQAEIILRDLEGLYHVRIWVLLNGDQILATDLVLWVTNP
jgi:uncharacterized protein YkwD